MCGRLTLHTPVMDWLLEFFPTYANLWPASISAMVKTHPGITQARYNIPPTESVLVIRQFSADAMPELEAMRWGLVPAWADSLKIAYSMINARAETLEDKPTYKPLLAKGRCVIVADGYYEWKQVLGPDTTKQNSSKQTYWIHRPGSRPLALAGLWTSNSRSLDGKSRQEPLLSTTIITTNAGVDTINVHDRMPVLLNDQGAVARWLCADADYESVKDLVCPSPQRTLEPTRVSSKVNSVRNQGPALIEPEMITPDLF